MGVEAAFGGGVDYAMLVKLYGSDPEAWSRHAPAIWTGARATPIMGEPDPEHISTSYTERQNLAVPKGVRRFTRLADAFSKNTENHAHAVALHCRHYNSARPHQTLENLYPRTPAMAADSTDHISTIEETVGLPPD